MAGSSSMAKPLDLRAWLVEQCADYRFDVSGVFQRTSEQSGWPLHAAGPEELEQRLVQGGHLLPLPQEPAALANVLEVSIVNFLVARVLQVPEAEVRRGTERGYPDLEISGPAFGGGFHAVDVKAARRSRAEAIRKAGSPCTPATPTLSIQTCTGPGLSARSAATPRTST